jgi:hypothetical protein
MPISGIYYFEIKKLETIETALPLNFTSGEGLDLSPNSTEDRAVVPEPAEGWSLRLPKGGRVHFCGGRVNSDECRDYYRDPASRPRAP